MVLMRMRGNKDSQLFSSIDGDLINDPRHG